MTTKGIRLFGKTIFVPNNNNNKTNNTNNNNNNINNDNNNVNVVQDVNKERIDDMKQQCREENAGEIVNNKVCLYYHLFMYLNH